MSGSARNAPSAAPTGWFTWGPGRYQQQPGPGLHGGVRPGTQQLQGGAARGEAAHLVGRLDACNQCLTCRHGRLATQHGITQDDEIVENQLTGELQPRLGR